MNRRVLYGLLCTAWTCVYCWRTRRRQLQMCLCEGAGVRGTLGVRANTHSCEHS